MWGCGGAGVGVGIGLPQPFHPAQTDPPFRREGGGLASELPGVP